MSRIAIAFATILCLAGCRSGFPSLSQAPEGAPPELVAARDAAAAERARLQDIARTTAAPSDAPPPALATPAPAAAARLLAVLPANEATPPGVVERAAEDSRRTGRALRLVGVGPDGPAAAERVAKLFRARGMDVSVSAFDGIKEAASRVELYLLP